MWQHHWWPALTGWYWLIQSTHTHFPMPLHWLQGHLLSGVRYSHYHKHTTLCPALNNRLYKDQCYNFICEKSSDVNFNIRHWMRGRLCAKVEVCSSLVWAPLHFFIGTPGSLESRTTTWSWHPHRQENPSDGAYLYFPFCCVWTATDDKSDIIPVGTSCSLLFFHPVVHLLMFLTVELKSRLSACPPLQVFLWHRDSQIPHGGRFLQLWDKSALKASINGWGVITGVQSNHCSEYKWAIRMLRLFQH